LRSNFIHRSALLLACAVPVLLGGSRAGADSLSLAEARRRAREGNYDLLAARSDVDQAQAQQIVAREIQNPSLSIASDSTVAVSQLVELRSHRTLRRAASEHSTEAARERFADARRTLDAAVVKSYAAAALGAENARLLNAAAASLRQSAAIARERLAAGDISSAEERQIEVEADRFDADAKAAEAAARTARIAVDVLLGAPRPAGDWQVADSLAALAQAAEGIAAAPALPRPDLLAAEASLQRADADLSLQKALRIPDPTVQLQVQRDPQPPSPATTVGIGMELPLWNRRRGEVAAAEVTRDQAARERARIAAQVAADQATAAASFANARERWQSYRSAILPKAEEVRTSVVYAYQNGGAPLLALLEAERSASQVRLAVAQAAADTITTGADLAAARNVPFLETPETKP